MEPCDVDNIEHVYSDNDLYYIKFKDEDNIKVHDKSSLEEVNVIIVHGNSNDEKILLDNLRLWISIRKSLDKASKKIKKVTNQEK